MVSGKTASEAIGLSYAREMGITGRDITVAVLDTGIFEHRDFCLPRNRIICFKDFVYNRKNVYDNNGHGTHIAGVVGSSGVFGNQYVGVAPDCNLVILKVLDDYGNGKITDVVLGLQFILENQKRYNIRIVNLSMGTPLEGKDRQMLIDMVETCWDSGLIVCVAAGNKGPYGRTITVPGISRKVITVASSDDGNMTRIGREKMKNYSSQGPTMECVIKPEIIAPGSNIVSCTNSFAGYTVKSGTSMATPVVSGAIALLLEMKPGLTNKEVKRCLYESSIDLGYPKNKQGWGQLSIPNLLNSC